MNLNQVTLPASDIAVSAAFYRAMGFTQIVDAQHYARFECPTGNSTFSLHKVELVPANSAIVIYFETEDVDEKVRSLTAKGFEFTQLPTDERWLWREARLKDPAGNLLCLYWAGRNRKCPPWRVSIS